MHKGRRKEKKLSLPQVARLKERQKELGYTLVVVREKFDAALKARGHTLTPSALKGRVDRLFNARMRGPLNDENKMVLAQALEWTPEVMESELCLVKSRASRDGKKTKTQRNEKKPSARQIALAALVQLETYQIGRGVDLAKDNLSRVYVAAYRMFQSLRDLMSQLPADEFSHDGAGPAIYEILNDVLNKTLRPHMTNWPEKYEEWRKGFSRTATGKKLSTQELQKYFPRHVELVRDLKEVARQLQSDARRLKSLILAESKVKKR